MNTAKICELSICTQPVSKKCEGGLCFGHHRIFCNPGCNPANYEEAKGNYYLAAYMKKVGEGRA